MWTRVVDRDVNKGVWAGGGDLECTLPSSPKTAKDAVGMHPTGMRSCLNVVTYLRIFRCHCYRGDGDPCTPWSHTCLAGCIDHRSYCRLNEENIT